MSESLDRAQPDGTADGVAASEPENDARDALRRGDHRAALTILMRAHGDAIFRYCLRLVGEHLAEDVHQVTFVHAFRSFHQFHGRSSLRTWLYGIARHRGLDALRKQRRRPVNVAEAPDVADPGSTVDGRLSARQLLERCLEKLAPKARDSIVLRYQEGMSYPEMAEVCDEKPAALQMRVSRVLPRLRRCLESNGER